MTHPDDEISICAWIQRLRDRGIDVFMSWTHSTPAREREARNFAANLKIPQEKLRFFQAPDGHVIDEIPRLMGDYSRWIEEVSPSRVCCGAFEQGHLDHDATHFLVGQTFAGPILEIPFYHGYWTRIQTLNRFADPEGEEILELSPSEQRFKKAIAKSYPSTNIWSVLFWNEAYGLLRGRAPRLYQTERMRVCPSVDYLRPAGPPKVAQKTVNTVYWKRWLDAVGPILGETPAS